MPLLSALNLVSLAGHDNKGKLAVSFAYNFVGDPIQNLSFGGASFRGTQYVADVSSLPGPANLPPFKSLLFSAAFDNSSPDLVDGELLIAVSGTEQIMRFGMPLAADTDGIVVLTACVPIASNAPTKITFAKAVDGVGGGVAFFGNIQATLFSYDVAPFVSYGYAAS